MLFKIGRFMIIDVRDVIPEGECGMGASCIGCPFLYDIVVCRDDIKIVCTKEFIER